MNMLKIKTAVYEIAMSIAIAAIAICLFTLIASAQNNKFRYHTVIDNTKPNYTPSSVTWKQGHLSIVHDSTGKKIDFYTNDQSGNNWKYRFSIPIDLSGGGLTPEFRATSTAIEWKYTTETNWRFLIALSDLKGDKGDTGIQGIKGDKGDKGDAGQAATVSVGTVTTLPSGSNATVTNSGTSSNAVFNFGIPRGADGASGGGSVTAFATPSSYSGTDADKLEACIASGKPIFIDMNLNLTRSVNFPATRANGLVIYGNFYKIKSVTNFSGYLIGRPTPANLDAAVTMMNYPISIYNLQVEGFSNQTGIDLGATYGAWYENIYCYNLNVGLHLKFALQTTVNNLRTWHCNFGSIADWYQGQSWATVHNSQSNLTVYRSPRLYSTNANAIGIAMYSCDGGTVYDMVIEGTTAKHAVVWDAMNANTVKKFRLVGLHVECVNGLSGEAVKLASPGGFAEISDIIGHYADILCSATSNGVLVVSVSNIGWWVMKNGKAFVNNNCGWVLSNLSQNIIIPSNLNASIQAAFTGTVPQPTTGAVTGYNQFKYLY